MRTNIVIDDSLMTDAIKATGAKTKREAVELALRKVVQLEAQKKFLALKGRVRWDGDLDEMRRDR
ncbi:MAG: type II toxin-antitoxin system VapB family antitoxin [Pacificimonas sp.]|jgi:Arc/MetJ family transcription regulator|nr:type II toxin-antitoxin system VapB family antitoxin [Pacificimonas sp.]